ncbi:hypothetical protein [Brachybacterium fresconis]|uniref:Type II secretory pathway pseudopilin PulG n=1 Tax=Brachybacterium fresconis TaxID=173363 RepID=A0ABS4YP51_9MICO|nr:hypothetical protein [Brachybacterium fresconis]MBP2410187.1 type II secretory pathway pseudopilin PulG [Brachybacterium fresconis]
MPEGDQMGVFFMRRAEREELRLTATSARDAARTATDAMRVATDAMKNASRLHAETEERLRTEADAATAPPSPDGSTAAPASKPVRNSPERASWWERWGKESLAVVTAVATLLTLVFVALQARAASTSANAAQEQTRAALAEMESRTRAADREFLSGIRISNDPEGVLISNTTSMTLPSVAYWYLQNTGGSLDEVEGAIGGIPLCSTVHVPWAHLEESRPNQDDAPAEQFAHDASAAAELHLAVQAPSGAWFLMGASGSLYSIDIAEPTAAETSRAVPQKEWPDENPAGTATYPYEVADVALEALHQADLHHTAPDTYREGADEVSTFTADPIIGSGDAVTTQSTPTTVVLHDESCT